MARLNKEDTQIISLFPMFNILVCAMGVLIFILSAVTTLSLGVGKSVSVILGIPNNSSNVKKPHYIEWDGTSLIMHPSQQKVAFDVNLSDMKTYDETYEYINKKIKDTPLEKLLKEVYKHRDQDYLIILVRPSGFSHFTEIRGYIESSGIDIGYEPVDQEWKLRIK